MGPIFSSPGDSHTEGLLVLLHPSSEGVTEVDTDAKRRFVSFKVTPFNNKVLSVYAPSWHSTREQVASKRFFEGLQIYMGNKNEGNEKEIILGDFNCSMDKMDRDVGNKTQRLFRCCSNYALSKLNVGN